MRAIKAPKNAVFSRQSLKVSVPLHIPQRQTRSAKIRALAINIRAIFFIVVGVLFGAAIVVAVVAFFHFVANVDDGRAAQAVLLH